MASSSSLPHYSNLDLTNEEATAIYTPDFDFFDENPNTILIGKFISSKLIDDWAVLQAFEGIWKKNNLKSKSIIRNSFLRIEFATPSERNDVFERGPWLYKDEWLALAEYNTGKSMEEYSFNPM
ncbi:hypothetical protein HRI_001656700 [Hibiscus trionum]|uniref:DUF4283 domain-containing protein n=1 Tax=Hibiscus trionum TaxID=183268 RepID=A0A9W7HL97_HIBTR|nr:hypothetical protein HRI_001656700 [Hibiscus trionum]